MLFIRNLSIYIHAPIESETIVHGLRRNVVDLSDVVSLWPHEIPSRMQLSQIRHFQSRIHFSNLVSESNANHRTRSSLIPGNPWIICQSSHNLETNESFANPCTPWEPINTIFHQNPSNLLPWSNPHKHCQSLSFWGNFLSSSKQALVQPPLSTDLLIHLYPLMISTTFVQFQTSTSFPECSKKAPTFNLTCHLTRCFFQSAYRIFHSTETTLLEIHNNLILAMDRGEVTCILLDLFAAFDTVDHFILLDHPSSQLVRFSWYFT